MKSGVGKIIAIIGAPRSGKSFLAKKLAAHYGAKLFLEGEHRDGREFPVWLEESIVEDKWHLARQLWFRSQLVRTHLAAVAERDAGRLVIADTFWLSSQFYVETTLRGFEQELMREVTALDRRWLSLPDLVIWLKISEANIKRFLVAGGRSFDQSEAYLRETILPVNEAHNQFFGKLDSEMEGKVLTVERDKLDFENVADLGLLVEQIDEKLKS